MRCAGPRGTRIPVRWQWRIPNSHLAELANQEMLPICRNQLRSAVTSKKVANKALCLIVGSPIQFGRYKNYIRAWLHEAFEFREVVPRFLN